MNHQPPKWADRFLQWYCRPELLEEIQGDAYELFYRKVMQHPRQAKVQFVWNVVRFFRWKNIKRTQNKINKSRATMDMLKNILTVALRNFVRQPGNTSLSVIGLTAGFVCAFLVMLWSLHEYSYDSFHPQGEQLFKVLTHAEANGTKETYSVASCVMDVSSIPEVESLTSVSTGTRWPHQLCFRPEGKADECIYMDGVYASENFFQVFHFPILQGDTNPVKGTASIAISEKMAEALYGKENPLGKVIKIDGTREVKIVSIFQNVPATSSLQFDFVMTYDVLKKQWGIDDEGFKQNFFEMYVKTHQPISADLLTEKLNDVRVITEAYKNEKLSYQAFPFTDWHLKSKFEDGKNTGGRIDYVMLFLVIGCLVVIMAVINFINLTTARASLRGKEIGIRKVTGAMRSTIAAQFMGEAFLLVMIAFALSVVITQATLPIFGTLIQENLSVDIFSGWTPAYLLVFLLAVSLLAGAYPAIVMSSFQPIRALKNQLTMSATGSQRFRKLLLTIQLSVSIGIIIFSGVIYSQLKYITEKDLGFDRSNMLRIEPTYRLLLKFEAFKNELAKDPNIVSVGAANSNPLNMGGSNMGVTWQGKEPDARIAFKTLGCNYSFPNTMGLKLSQGRLFELSTHDSVRTEMILTEESAKIMGFTNPIGEEIKIGGTTGVVIGVVNDFHTESLHEARVPVILFRTAPEHLSTIYVKYQPGSTIQSMESIANAYKLIEPAYTMKYWFQDETFDEIYKTETVASRLVILLTVIALAIAIIGIVGLATFNVLRKMKEMSIRRVFGASAVQVLQLLVREFLAVILLAIVITIPLIWYRANEWLNGFAYHTAMPWRIFVVACVGIVLLITLIIVLQGVKTIRTNPTQTLRSE
ncbi:MAG: ABC transporter permease [Bacteroidetes bacterium]|nr:ABC transporter permease [Bacteroidota bacterium]